MPACAAHYQFGRDMLSRMDEKTRSCALAYKREYDWGLQGPDIFFFYKPCRRTKIREYGIARHNEPAAGMFAPILAKPRENAALSYLLGLIGHYALDKSIHPYIYAHSAERYWHHRMEAAYDRHIIRVCGLSARRYLYLPSGGLDYGAMASLWPGVDAETVRKCVAAERRATRFLDRRRFLEACEKLAGRPGVLTPITLPDDVPEEMQPHIRNLEALYEKALDESQALIRKALEAMGTKLQDLAGYELNYKGEAIGQEADN
jgi:hypothetical protein